MKLDNKKPAVDFSRPKRVIHLDKYSTSIITKIEVKNKRNLLLAKCEQLNHSSIPEFINILFWGIKANPSCWAKLYKIQEGKNECF